MLNNVMTTIFFSHLVKIANAVNGGKLVPEDVIFTLLSKRLEEGYYGGESGFILNGIPQTRIQAEILDQIVDVDLVVNFKRTEEQLVKKNLETEACASGQEFLSTGSAGFPLLMQTVPGGKSSASMQSRARHWKITTGNGGNFLTFKWLVHPEKPGKDCWLHYISSM